MLTRWFAYVFDITDIINWRCFLRENIIDVILYVGRITYDVKNKNKRHKFSKVEKCSSSCSRGQQQQQQLQRLGHAAAAKAAAAGEQRHAAGHAAAGACSSRSNSRGQQPQQQQRQGQPKQQYVRILFHAQSNTCHARVAQNNAILWRSSASEFLWNEQLVHRRAINQSKKQMRNGNYKNKKKVTHPRGSLLIDAALHRRPTPFSTPVELPPSTVRNLGASSRDRSRSTADQCRAIPLGLSTMNHRWKAHEHRHTNKSTNTSRRRRCKQ